MWVGDIRKLISMLDHGMYKENHEATSSSCSLSYELIYQVEALADEDVEKRSR